MLGKHFSEIDKELLGRLEKQGCRAEIKNNRFTGDKTERYYCVNGKKTFAYLYKNNDGILSGNAYIAAPAPNDARNAINVEGRAKSWGKKITLEKTGNSAAEQYDYIADLVAQVGGH